MPKLKTGSRFWAPLVAFKTEEFAARPQPYFADLADAQASVATYIDYTNTSADTLRSPIRLPNPFIFNNLKMRP